MQHKHKQKSSLLEESPLPERGGAGVTPACDSG